MSIVQGPFSAAPCQTLAFTIRNFCIAVWQQASVDTVLREAVKVELNAMGLVDVPEELIDEEVARIKATAGTDGAWGQLGVWQAH